MVDGEITEADCPEQLLGLGDPLPHVLWPVGVGPQSDQLAAAVPVELQHMEKQETGKKAKPSILL